MSSSLAGEFLAGPCENPFFGFLLYPVDEKVFKKPQDTYLIFYMGSHFIRRKEKAPIARVAISKAGAVLISQGHSGCHVIYLYEKGQLRSTDLSIIFSSSVGIHRLCYIESSDL